MAPGLFRVRLTVREHLCGGPAAARGNALCHSIAVNAALGRTPHSTAIVRPPPPLQSSNPMTRLLPLLALGLLLSGAALSGCDAAGPEADGALTARFALAPDAQTGSAAARLAADALVIEGANGRLELTDIRFVVDKLKFERDDAACESAEAGDAADADDCEEVEAPPFFLALPLDGTAVDVGTGRLVPGLYEEFEFEVEDLDLDDEPDDEDADDDDAEYGALAEAVRAEFPAWPDGASAVFVGSFVPADGGAARPFTAFVDAEVEVEMEFEPPVEVGEDAGGAFTVEIDPAAWFASASGDVLDLSAYDAGSGRDLLELEAKLKDGFRSLKVETDDSDDD